MFCNASISFTFHSAHCSALDSETGQRIGFTIGLTLNVFVRQFVSLTLLVKEVVDVVLTELHPQAPRICWRIVLHNDAKQTSRNPGNQNKTNIPNNFKSPNICAAVENSFASSKQRSHSKSSASSPRAAHASFKHVNAVIYDSTHNK